MSEVDLHDRFCTLCSSLRRFSSRTHSPECETIVFGPTPKNARGIPVDRVSAPALSLPNTLF